MVNFGIVLYTKLLATNYSNNEIHGPEPVSENY